MPHTTTLYGLFLRPRSGIYLCCCLLLTGLLLSTPSLAKDQVDENQLKAMIIYRLLQFSSWQPAHQKEAGICVIGSTELHTELMRINIDPAQNFKIELSQIPPPNHCQVIIIGPQANKLSQEQSRNKFIICNNCNSKELAAIHLFRTNDKIQFDINRRAAETSGVHFPSSVLKAARMVEGGS